MHRSGITVSNELRDAFASAVSENIDYFKIGIQDESFKVLAKGSSGASDITSKFKVAQGFFEEKSAAYLAIHGDDKWILIYYVPEAAPVREKMLFSSSRTALKDGLGSSSFSADYFISLKSECTHERFNHMKTESIPTRDLLTLDEFTRHEAHLDSLKSMGSAIRVTAIADIPVKLTEGAQTAISGFADGSVQTVWLSLDSETETLSGRAEQKCTPEEIATKFSPREPQYLLFNFHHEKQPGQMVATPFFIYYCPDIAPPRLKMFYSACKSMIVKIFDSLNVKADKKIEISDSKELTSAFLFDELYPKVVEKKTFSKPKAAGKGGARLHGNAKFSNE